MALSCAGIAPRGFGVMNSSFSSAEHRIDTQFLDEFSALNALGGHQ